MAWEVVEEAPEDTSFSGYPAEDTPVFPTYRDIPADPEGVSSKGIELLGRAERTPRVILGKTVSDVPGLVEPGTIDLTDPFRPTKDAFHIEDGGLHVVLPKWGSREAMISQYKETGENFGMFKDEKSADEYTQHLATYQDLSAPKPYGLEVAGENKFGSPTRTKAGRKDAAEVNAELERQQTPMGRQKMVPVEPQESLRAKDRQVGLVTPGNIDLDNLTPVATAGGDADTLLPIAITEPGKKQTVLIPTIIDGKEFPINDAIRDYRKTGKHLGVFKDPIAADEYKRQLQDRQNQFYGLASNIPTQLAEGNMGRPELSPSYLSGIPPQQFDTQPPQEDVPDVVSNRGLLASTAKGIPIVPPSQEESDRLIRSEQFDKIPANQDRINVPEVDSSRFEVLDDARDIPIYDPTNLEVVDEKALPPTERNPANFEVVPGSPGSPAQPVAKVTAYRPGGGPSMGLSQGIEGGINDAHETPILGKTTMEDYQAGRGDYVTVAMDKNSSWQNQFLSSPAFPGTVFRVRDNGGYGNGKTGENWVDIAYTDPQKAKSMMLHGVPFQPITPDEAQKISESRPYVENKPDLKSADITPPTTSAFGRMAGIPKAPEEFAPRQHAYDSAEATKANAITALEGFQGSLQGSSAALAKYVAKPVFGGIQNAIHALAPDSELSKYTAGLYDQFNKFAVEETGKAAEEKLTPKAGESTMGQISRMLGQTVGDIAQIIPTAGAGTGLRAAVKAPEVGQAIETAAPTVFNVIKQQLPGLGRNAEAMAVPALRSGMQASDMAARMGASPADQNLAFTKAALLTMGSAALPLGVESNAANIFTRFVERAAKAAPLGVAAGAAIQGAENILSPGEARPFDPKQLTINAVPIVLLAGALGHNVQPRARGPIARQAFPKTETATMPGEEITLASKTPAVVPPLTTRISPPPIPPGGGEHPRIKPVAGRLRKFPFLEMDLTRGWQGVAEILEKSGFTQLGQAIRNHYDQFRVYSGMTQAPIRAWAKEISKADLKQAHQEFQTYWQSVDERWQFIESAMLETPERLRIGGPSEGGPSSIKAAENKLAGLAGMGEDFVSQLRAKRAEMGWDDATYLARMQQAIDRVSGTTTAPAAPPAALPGPPGTVPAQTPSQAIYDSSSPKGKELIDLWKRLGRQTGDIAVKNKLEVYDHDNKTWRPFRKIGEGRFFPRRISAKWLEIMSKPDQYPTEMADLKREIVARGYVRQLSEVDGYLARALKAHTPDKLSPLEHARTSPLPTRVYDYSFDTALNYLRNWSYDMARIEAYGQKKHGADAFTIAQGMTHDTYSKQYIDWIQKLAYRQEDKGRWATPLNVGMQVSTMNMLGNFRTSMRNVIGGILYNTQYNGILAGAKAFLQVHKLAGEIDNAYERGILQDNLHNLQQDVQNNMSPVGRLAEKVLKSSGYQKAEEFTRAMNLMAARTFLRNAIKSNQKNPESGRTLQYRATIQRMGGIDPEALLREGGVGPVTDRFLRQNVAAIQGGYGLDQTPASMNTPEGRFVLQLQKWGTQAADIFIKEVANPAVRAVSLGMAGKKETVQVPNPDGSYRAVKVPGALLPVARFLLLSTAAGLTQKELEHFLLGIEDKEASFAEVLTRLDNGDSKAFGDLIHKVWMANMSVGAAGVIGNYSQMFTDAFTRSRFKDPMNPPAMVLPVAATQLLVDYVTQGKLTGMDLDAFLRNNVSAYKTTQQLAARLNDFAGGNIVALKAVSNRNDLQWLRSITRRYDNVIGQETTFVPGTVKKTPLTPFNSELKEALMMGDSGRAADLLDAHLDPLTPSARKGEMERIKQSVRGSHPLRVGGGTGVDMQENFKDWEHENLPIKDQLRVDDIVDRYEDTAVGLKLMKPTETSSRKKSEALKRIEDRAAVKAAQ